MKRVNHPVGHRVLAAAVALAATAFGSLTQAQQPALKPPVIELRNPACAVANSCQPVLVNKETTNRVVATVKVTPSGATGLMDQRGDPITVREQYLGVLLLPGEQKALEDRIAFEGGYAMARGIKFTFAVVGFYTPRPDLNELPRPPAADKVRYYDNVGDGSLQAPCPAKYGTKSWGTVVVNLSLDHAINVTYRGKIPGFSQEVQTAYLAPGGIKGLGCISNWSKDIEISEIRYAD